MNSISLQIKKKRFEPVHRVQSPAIRRILHRIIQFHLPVPVRPMSFLRRFPGRGVPLRQLPLLPYGLRSRPADLVAGQLGRQHHNVPAAGPADSNLPSHPGRPALLPYYIIRLNVIANNKKTFIILDRSVPLPSDDRHLRHFGERPARRRPRLAFDSTARREPVVSSGPSHSRVNIIFTF